MPRPKVRTACQRCRKNRVKCDGKAPCAKCEARRQECTYAKSSNESKDGLRSKVEHLKRTSRENGILLDTLSNRKGTVAYNAVLEGLIQGEPRQSIVQMLSDYCTYDDDDNLDTQGLRRLSQPANINTGSQEDANGEDYFHRPPPFVPYHRHSFSSYGLSAGASESTSPSMMAPSTSPSSLSPHPDACGPPTDFWTRTGWTVSFVQQLFNNLATWDYLPLCLLCKDPFLQDYLDGRNRYCSSALVHALLALAYRLTFEGGKEVECQNHGRVCCSSKLFEEAERIVHTDDSFGISLPDIQALGILAIYQIGYGRNAEAYELIERFTTAITNLCLQEPLVGPMEEYYTVVRATTYCGAVSLSRIFHLTTGQFSSLPNYRLKEDSVYLDKHGLTDESVNGIINATELDAVFDSYQPHLRNPKLMSVKVFQLTEWVYKLVSPTRLASGQIAPSEVFEVYTKCLDWYERICILLKADGADVPYAAFIHLFYQFCLLCLFRPFLHLSMKKRDFCPREICIQAYQSMLALANSYDGLYPLRRISGFAAYFDCGSSIMNLAIQESSQAAVMGT